MGKKKTVKAPNMKPDPVTTEEIYAHHRTAYIDRAGKIAGKILHSLAILKKMARSTTYRNPQSISDHNKLVAKLAADFDESAIAESTASDPRQMDLKALLDGGGK